MVRLIAEENKGGVQEIFMLVKMGLLKPTALFSTEVISLQWQFSSQGEPGCVRTHALGVCVCALCVRLCAREKRGSPGWLAGFECVRTCAKKKKKKEREKAPN